MEVLVTEAFLSVAAALAVAGTIGWVIYSRLNSRMTPAQIRGCLEHLVEHAEAGGSFQLGIDRRYDAVSVELASVEHPQAFVNITFNRLRLSPSASIRLERELTERHADNEEPLFWREFLDSTESLVAAAFSDADASSTPRIYIRWAGPLYGPRSWAGIRESYKTMPVHVPLVSRLRRLAERQSASIPYDPHLKRFCVRASFERAA